jgi:chromosome condensin MukBEF ATPase and DNA-binding subunit MukB
MTALRRYIEVQLDDVKSQQRVSQRTLDALRAQLSEERVLIVTRDAFEELDKRMDEHDRRITTAVGTLDRRVAILEGARSTAINFTGWGVAAAGLISGVLIAIFK